MKILRPLLARERSIMQRSALALTFALGGTTALQSNPAPQAGFDCNLAQSALERAICADPDTAQADRAMALAYQAQLAQTKDAAFAAALRADQRSFLSLREEGWAVERNPEMAAGYLRDATEHRAEWLNWLNPSPETGLVGTWANAWGLLEITRASDGGLVLEGSAVDQVAGTWRCGYDGGLVEDGPTRAFGRTLTEDLELLRNGPLVEIPKDFCDETGPAINGSMKGRYFRIGSDL